MLPQSFTSFEEEYAAIRTQAGFVRQGRGVLRLMGSEGIEFLQRLSTNDTDPLRVEKSIRTVFTSEKGKVIDLCTIVPEAGDLLVVTSPGTASRVRSWLEKYIIMEDITIADVSDSMTSCLVFGLKVKELLSQSLETVVDIPSDSPTKLTIDGNTLHVIPEPGPGLSCFHLISTTPVIEGFLSRVLVSGQKQPVVLRPIGSLAFESFRIERGLPSVGKDVTESINPLEASLRQYVSFTKGCYIGQEVIARIDTYDKLQKELRGMIIDAPQSEPLAPGEIWAASGLMGHTTSHAWSIALNRHVALGFVKTSYEGTAVEFRPAIDGGVSYPARIAGFPLC